MGLFTSFCVITVVFTGLASGADLVPPSLNAAVGNNVLFNPSLTPTQTPLYFISWEFKTKSIIIFLAGTTVSGPVYDNRFILSEFTGSLELRNLTLNDTGVYDVTIRLTANDAEIHGSTNLNVYEPVSNVTVTASNTDLVEFIDTVTLSCSASGSSLTFLWLNDGVEVTDSDRINITDGGAALTIVNVSRDDQGSYTCKASNPVSSRFSESVQLSVSYGPDSVIVSTSPPGEHHVEGSDVSLSCSADSRPVPQFRWFKNGQILSFTGAQINLVNIQMEQSGDYSCEAFNSKTNRYTTSPPAPISVWKNLTDISVDSSALPVEGSPLNLTCDASGSTSREWMINGIELKPSENIVFYDQNRVLSFRRLTRTDNGKYTCRVNNPAMSQTIDYLINVNYGPENIQISDPGKLQEGNTLRLSCLAESEPAANFTWTKNGTTLGQSQEFTKDDITLSDSGVYICRATNDITEKTSEASRTVNVTEIIGGSTADCSTGCIVGIVLGCIAVVLIVTGGVFYALKKKKQKPKSNTRTDGVGQDNSAYEENQEVQYADVMFVKKDGVVVPLGQQSNTEYAEVRKNNRPPSHPPTYDAHMQRERTRAAEPPTLYSEIRPK